MQWLHAMYCIRHIENSGKFRTLFIQVNACIFKHIQHFKGIFRLIQAYSGPCVTLTYSQPCYILSPGIFRTRGIFKILWIFDPAYSELCHSQKFIQALCGHIQAYSQLCVMLAYAETWHIWNPTIFRTVP